MKYLEDRLARTRRSALKGELAREMLRRFGTLRLQVTGHSMLPSVWPGDVLLIQGCQLGEVSPGDIVLFSRHGRLFAHRVVGRKAELENPRLVTQGDAMSTADPPIASEEFLGKVSQILYAGKLVAPAATLDWKNKLVASVARYSTLAARFLVFLHVSRANYRKPEVLCSN